MKRLDLSELMEEKQQRRDRLLEMIKSVFTASQELVLSLEKEFDDPLLAEIKPLKSHIYQLYTDGDYQQAVVQTDLLIEQLQTLEMSYSHWLQQQDSVQLHDATHTTLDLLREDPSQVDLPRPVYLQALEEQLDRLDLPEQSGLLLVYQGMDRIELCVLLVAASRGAGLIMDRWSSSAISLTILLLCGLAGLIIFIARQTKTSKGLIGFFLLTIVALVAVFAIS